MNIDKLFGFVDVSNNLKFTERFSNSSPVKGDSSASHSWHLALLAFLIADELKLSINVLHAVKLSLVHDLPEAIVGDIDATLIFDGDKTVEDKSILETKAASELQKLIGFSNNNLNDLWQEYESAKTNEAKFVKALDKIEALLHLLKSNNGPGCHYAKYYNLVGSYANKQVKNFPGLRPILKEIKNRLKIKFKEKNIPWKEEYDQY